MAVSRPPVDSRAYIEGCYSMNAFLLNREGFQMPTDGWYQLAPLGDFAHAAAGVIQVVDSEACTAMAARFKADAAVPNFAGLLVDFDHFSLDERARSEAAGWIVNVESRDTGLWANIRWSDVGEEAVKGGRYRFLSPVWARSDCVDLGNGRVRPVRLLNAAVTNDPNLKGIRPLSNSGRDLRPETIDLRPNAEEKTGMEVGPVDSGACNRQGCGRAEGGDPEAERFKRESEFEQKVAKEAKGGSIPVDSCACNRGACVDHGKDGTTMKRVIERLVNHLGLPGDATEDAILEKIQGLPSLTAVTDLQNSLKKAQDERDALKADLQNSVKQSQADRDALQGKLKGAEDELVNRHLAEFEGVISEATKPFWAEQLLTNRQGALLALADVARAKVESGKSNVEGEDGKQSAPAGQAAQTKRPLHNRATARPVIPGMGGANPSTGSGSSEGRAVKIRNRAHEIAKGEGVAFSTAFRRAEKEVCEE